MAHDDPGSGLGDQAHVLRGSGRSCQAPRQRTRELRLASYEEGRSVQIMHVGPPARETATLVRLHQEYLPAHGLVPKGPHHEIYLTDPSRTAPERMKTVLRQPVRRQVKRIRQ